MAGWISYTQAWLQLPPASFQDWVAFLFISAIILSSAVMLFHWNSQPKKQQAQDPLKLAEWQARYEFELEFDRLREAAFQTYLDRMTELLLEKGLRLSTAGAEVRNIARARTLTALQTLDGYHKGILLRFLQESGLIEQPAIINLNGADLRGANLDKVPFRGVDLRGADLSGANLSEADLREANLHQSILIVANLSGADLHGADLGQANLTEAVLTAANLSEANLSCADLHGSNLEGTELIGAKLIKANLREAILIMTNLVEANLSGAILQGAHLEGAELIEANLVGADLSWANLQGASLRGARYNHRTRWPKEFTPAPAGAVLVDRFYR